MSLPEPPKLAERFFRWFCHHRHLEGLEGDLYELFKGRADEQGIKKARLHYIWDIITLLRPSVAKSFTEHAKSNFIIMGIINNYLKTILRIGFKQSWFSSINLLGLTLGISSVIFISIYIDDELKFDTNISDLDQKFRIYDIRYGEDGGVNYYPIVPPVFSSILKDNFPQVAKSGRVLFDYGGTIFNVGDMAFVEKNGVFAERPVLEILDLEMIYGDLSKMEEPNSVILSETTYQKFFGNVPFNNQSVKLTKSELQVAGVFKDLPEQFHLELDYIYPFELAVRNVSEERMSSWVWQQFYTYIQIKPGTDVGTLERQIQKYIAERAKPKTEDSGFYYTPYLQPLRNVHLHSSNFEWDIAKRGNYQSIVFLSIAALIILFIACLNFVNLSTARSANGQRKFVYGNLWEQDVRNCCCSMDSKQPSMQLLPASLVVL